MNGFTKRAEIRFQQRNSHCLTAVEIAEILALGNSRKDWATKFKHAGIRKFLPYGMWVTVSGERILFNRLYQPFLSQFRGKLTGERPDRWVEGIIATYRVYNDRCPPNDLYNPSMGITNVMQQTFTRCCEMLKAFAANTPTPELIQHCISRTWINAEGEHQFERYKLPVPEYDGDKIPCPECGGLFTTGGAMTAHMKFNHDH